LARDTPNLAGERVLVTGAAGFIGANLVQRLSQAGAEVLALVRSERDAWRLRHLPSEGVELVVGDLELLGQSASPERFHGVRRIFHLAAAGVSQTGQDPMEIVRTNVLGTLAALQLAERLDVLRFVYCGSCFEYGGAVRAREDRLPAPPSEYGASKAAGWVLAHAYGRCSGVPVASLRPFTVFGPLEGARRLVPHAIMGAMDGIDLPLTAGEQTRDFVFIDDAVEAFVAAATEDRAVGGTFNVCSGQETSVRHVVESVLELTQSNAEPLWGAVPYRPDEMWRLSGDPTHAHDVLGWTATTPLREGLRRTVEWFRENRGAHAEYPVAGAGA
jgi:UDP-glucose 4-epimerase